MRKQFIESNDGKELALDTKLISCAEFMSLTKQKFQEISPEYQYKICTSFYYFGFLFAFEGIEMEKK